MIKDFKECPLPDVDLGNLTVQNCFPYYVEKQEKFYPLAIFGKKEKDGGVTSMFEVDSPEKCPKGWTIRDQWDTPEERLLDYAQSLESEHKDCSNEHMLERGKFPFLGRKRNGRWRDEMLRRGLIKS